MLWAGLAGPRGSGRVLAGGIFLFLALTGNVLGKVRRNFWMGVRTPWTLANERVWNNTHRFTAWLFAIVGLSGFLGALAGVRLAALFGLIVLAALASVLYSLVEYKRLERRDELS